jgi:2-methylcitrate dehydratase PrpD
MKPWPSCRHTHPAIDAALELHGNLGGAVPRAVEVATYKAALDVCNRPEPANEYGAKFSLQHCVALALTDGKVGFESFDAAARARLAPLGKHIELRASEPYLSAYPKAWGARIAVRMPDGREAIAERNSCKGDPDRPLSNDEIVAKADLLLAHGGIEGATARRIIDGILALAGGGGVVDITAAINVEIAVP